MDEGLDRPNTATAPPVFPAGRHLHLPGRGDVFVRDVAGPPGAPVIVLLHGWTTTADVNWHLTYEALGRYFRVIAFDHRGHGRGLRTRLPFRLEDCADDVTAIATVLGVDRFIPVGYSMGGPVAELVWRRHRHRVDGLVLCATSRHFADSAVRRTLFSVLDGTCALAATSPFRSVGRLTRSAWSRRLQRRCDAPWMIEQVLRHDWNRVLEAGRAIGRYDARDWSVRIDVPTAVLAALDDDIVPTEHQLALAAAVPGATLHTVAGGHATCADRAGQFVHRLLDACHSVAERAAIHPGRHRPHAA